MAAQNDKTLSLQSRLTLNDKNTIPQFGKYSTKFFILTAFSEFQVLEPGAVTPDRYKLLSEKLF
jgi:hypothetical protein